MRKNILKSSIFIVILILSLKGYSQKFGMGFSAIYNPQTESFGIGLRAEIPKDKISIVPQIAYYPAFNKVSEFYAGVSFHLNVLNIKNWNLYTLANGSYNGWLNYNNSQIENAKLSNWDGELGLGLTTRGCTRPFIEYRYNFKWKETNLRVGVMFYFKCNNKKSVGKRKHREMTCPAYD